MKNMQIADTDVLLLAAGYGTRLKPLTDSTPKPLIKVAGKALLDWNLELLAKAGFKRVFINVHHLAQQIVDHVGTGSKWNLSIQVVSEPLLLDTGGAIKNIEKQIQSDALVTINSDILIGSDFSFEQLFVKHFQDLNCPLVTMVVRHDAAADSYGALEINKAGRICSFCGKTYFSQDNLDKVMFLGIQIITKEVLKCMPPAGSVFSITRDTITQLLAQGKYLSSYLYDGYWNDVGTPSRLESASKEMEHDSD